MKKILIIGSEGFIGSNAVDFFLERGWKVSGIDIKHAPHAQYDYHQILAQTTEYSYLFENIKPDVCLFASGSASVSISINDPLSDLDANFLQVTRILNMIRLHCPACKFINISSAAVYGNPKQLPVSETDEIAPLSPYGWHKYFSEMACREYSALYSIKTCSIRPFSVYGPGQKKLLLWDIFNKHKKNDLVLFGTGKETRDFIYISDFLTALELIIGNTKWNGESINVANGVETSVADIARMFLNKLGNNSEISFTRNSREGDPLNWRADISFLKKLGFNPRVSLDEGLKNYASWLAANYNTGTK